MPSRPSVKSRQMVEEYLITGTRAYEQGQLSEAQKFILAAIHEASEWDGTPYELGLAYYRLHLVDRDCSLLDDARQHLQLAMGIFGKLYVETPSKMIPYHYACGQLLQAMKLFSEAETEFRLAVALLDTSNDDLTEKERAAIEEVCGDKKELLQNLAQSLVEQKRYTDAQSVYESVLTLVEEADPDCESPDNFLQPLLNVAMNLRRLDYTMEAEKREEDYLSTLRLIHAHSTTGMVDALCKKALSLSPTQPDISRILFSYALQETEKHFGPDGPRSAVILGSLGKLCHKSLQDLTAAAAYLERGVRISQNHNMMTHAITTLQVTLAHVVIDMGNFPHAASLLDEALENVYSMYRESPTLRAVDAYASVLSAVEKLYRAEDKQVRESGWSEEEKAKNTAVAPSARLFKLRSRLARVSARFLHSVRYLGHAYESQGMHAMEEFDTELGPNVQYPLELTQDGIEFVIDIFATFDERDEKFLSMGTLNTMFAMCENSEPPFALPDGNSVAGLTEMEFLAQWARLVYLNPRVALLVLRQLGYEDDPGYVFTSVTDVSRTVYHAHCVALDPECQEAPIAITALQSAVLAWPQAIAPVPCIRHIKSPKQGHGFVIITSAADYENIEEDTRTRPDILCPVLLSRSSSSSSSSRDWASRCRDLGKEFKMPSQAVIPLILGSTGSSSSNSNNDGSSEMLSTVSRALGHNFGFCVAYPVTEDSAVQGGGCVSISDLPAAILTAASTKRSSGAVAVMTSAPFLLGTAALAVAGFALMKLRS